MSHYSLQVIPFLVPTRRSGMGKSIQLVCQGQGQHRAAFLFFPASEVILTGHFRDS